MKAAISRIEYYLPLKTETAADLLHDNPDWRTEDIEKKTGIKKRYISASTETAVDMAVKAAVKLFATEEEKNAIDCLILVTQSPDYVLPASACIVQEQLGLKKNCLGFDVNQGCSGFIVGLALAASLVESKTAGTVLLLCSETYTKYIDKHDRTSRPVFSDGASAILVTGSTEDNIGPFDFGTDGTGAANLIVKNSGARHESENNDGNTAGHLFMNGSEVFMFTMDMVPKSVSALLSASGKSMGDIDLFIFHQASFLVLSNIQRRLQIPDNKIFNNIENIGNTVSATIPIALKQAADAGIAKKGHTIMLVGFGVGYSWGSCIIKYNS
ncbi:MAG: ketoacyl-ACP synthase III [Bacteroidota bacterium]